MPCQTASRTARITEWHHASVSHCGPSLHKAACNTAGLPSAKSRQPGAINTERRIAHQTGSGQQHGAALGEHDNVAEFARLVADQVAVHRLQQRLRGRHDALQILRTFAPPCLERDIRTHPWGRQAN